MSVLIIEVKRNRQSVTQGSATVFINGKEGITFGDEMYLKNNNGTFTNGFKAATNVRHYGEVIDGWGSITPDSSFILGLLYHPYDPVYHHSDIVRKAILAMDEEMTFNEIVTPELKVRICDLFEKHGKMAEEQDEYVDKQRGMIRKLRIENRQLKSDFDTLLSVIRGLCKTCKYIGCSPFEDPCRDCNKIIKQNYEFKGLE